MNPKLRAGLASVLQMPADLVDEKTRLDSGAAPWDSLAVVSTISVVDEACRVVVDGGAVAKCETVADVLELIREEGGNP